MFYTMLMYIQALYCMMSFWFVLCVLGIVALIPVHFRSVEHIKLNEKYGEERGRRIGEIMGIMSGWGYFIFLFGLWIAPQETYVILPESVIIIPITDLQIGLVNTFIAFLFLVPGAYLGIAGVRATGLKVSETHRTESIVRSNIYCKIRHPQYLGAFLSHVGMSFLLSGFYSLLATPLIIITTYLTSRKEEEELIREFGDEYRAYTTRVPMFIPRLRSGEKREGERE